MPCSHHDKPFGWDTSFGESVYGSGDFVGSKQVIVGTIDDEVRGRLHASCRIASLRFIRPATATTPANCSRRRGPAS